jgi:hypothetical protein
MATRCGFGTAPSRSSSRLVLSSVDIHDAGEVAGLLQIFRVQFGQRGETEHTRNQRGPCPKWVIRDSLTMSVSLRFSPDNGCKADIAALPKTCTTAEARPTPFLPS